MTLANTKLKVTGIDHVVLHVNDLDRSRRFDVDLLGFEVRTRVARIVPALRRPTRCALRAQGFRDRRGAEMNHMALRLQHGDYEEVKAILEAEQIEVTGRPGDDHCIYFSDPDGHRLQLLTVREQH